MSADLLPRSSGPFTAAVADIWDSFSRYAPFVVTIKNYGITITPDDWVPWIVWDYGLEDVVPYVRGYRKVLAEGPEWQATRGTDRGIEIGIGWVESRGEVAPPDGRHDWWKFQVGFTQPVDDLAQLRQIEGIINLSKSSEDVLFRMFSPDYDFRPVRMDMHRADRAGWYDGYSGTPRWQGGPIISFGRNQTIGVDVSPDVGSSTEITASTEVRWFDGFRYDNDTPRKGRERTLTSSFEMALNSDFAEPDDVWPDEYSTVAWSANNGPWPMQQRGTRYDEAGQIASRPDYWPDGYPVGVWAAGEEPSVIPIP